MDDKYEAWLVDDVANEHSLCDPLFFRAASKAEAITKAEEWAETKYQEVGPSTLIVKRPGEPGNIHHKRFNPLNP
jgi:hypothetical protein